MAARTIRSGIGTYQDVDGQWRHGVLGDEVDVHEDDLDRFDRLNPAAPDEPEAEKTDDTAGPTFSQEDVDAAVKGAVEAKDVELVEAKKALEAKTQEAADAVKELEALKAEKPKTPPRSTARQS